MSRTQIFLASTLYGAATVAAALDAGCFPPADRRLLLVSNNAAIPETTPALDAMPGFEALRDRFDAVLSWNAVIAPFPLAMTIALISLEALVALLQAYVFAILTCIYLNDALHPHH